MKECSVFTPCGRYAVRCRTDRKTTLELQVRYNAGNASILTLPAATRERQLQQCYTASVTPAVVQELTTAAGVAKPFGVFADMVYHALTGSSASVRFFVETLAEMKRRIASDVKASSNKSSSSSADNSDMNTSARLDGSQSRAAAAGGGGSAAAGSSCSIELSVSSEFAEDLYAQRFFTLDYDVDFTRAIFPIALQATAPSAKETTTINNSNNSSSSPVADADPNHPNTNSAPQADKGSSSSSSPKEDMRALWESQRAAEHYRLECERLRRENEALVRLSREKMLEMERLCADFQGHARATAEVDRLRAKNVELRVLLQQAQEERDAAVQALGRARLGSPGTVRRPTVSSSSSGRKARSGRLVSPTPPAAEVRRRNALEQQQQQRVTPVKRSGSGSRGRRFDTPPARPADRGRKLSPSLPGSGSRGAREGAGRASGRRSPSLDNDDDGGASYPGGRSRSRSGTAAPSAPRRCPSVGSVASSAGSSSHDRLYRTPTASSYAHRVTDTFTTDALQQRYTPRPVFK